MNLFTLIVLVLCLFPSICAAGDPTPIFSEDFEAGPGGWSIDQDVWQIGVPSSLPGAHGGVQCAATRLQGYYPYYPNNSRLISPDIALPLVSQGEEIHLRFWHWFSYRSTEFGSDWGRVQISVFDESNGWSEWHSVSGAIMHHSALWSPLDADITPLAGKSVRISFYHYNVPDSHNGESYGWYVDDLTITKGQPVFTGDFESGWEGWSADHGVWEIGFPSAGPAAPYSGNQCAGTVLNADYPPAVSSRLVSPSLRLPLVGPGGILELRFWHWYYGDKQQMDDKGYLQVSSRPVEGQPWTAWQYLSDKTYEKSLQWRMEAEDLHAYDGQTIRVAFYHTANDNASVQAGWYVDDVTLARTCQGDFNKDNDVDGGDLAQLAIAFGDQSASPIGDYEPDGDLDSDDIKWFGLDLGVENCLP